MFKSIPPGEKNAPSVSSGDPSSLVGGTEAPYFRQFERELAAFETVSPDLLTISPDRFVAIYHGQIIDEDRDEFVLAERVEQNYPKEFVLIRSVSRGLMDHLDSPEVE